MTMAKIISEGGSSMGTRVVLSDGTELEGLRKVVFTAEVDEVARVDVELLFVEAEVEGKLAVHVANPATGEVGPISKIVFADGTEWAAS